MRARSNPLRLPRPVWPAALLALGLAARPAGATITLRYYGGPVISNVTVVQVSWGPSVNAALVAQLPGFYATVTSSAYFDWLNEYSTRGLTGFTDGLPGSDQVIGRGSFSGGYTITPSVAGTTITDDQIQAELAAQIAAANLPPPTLDAHGLVNSLYMIDFPNGITIVRDTSQSCVQFCAYHFTANINGQAVPYGVLPFIGAGSPCAGGCGNAANDLDNEFSVHSHQLIEAVTDAAVGLAGAVARPLGWYSSAPGTGEIGDICNAQQGLVGGYTVQKEWSNLTQACILSVPGLPVCDGTPTRCRPCYLSDEAQAGGCSGLTPGCDLAPLSPSFGQCVTTTSTTVTSTSTSTSSSITTTTVINSSTSTSTTSTLPGSAEICGNCFDDDGGGLTDFEDPACCTQPQTTDMMPHKLSLAPGKDGVKLTLTATLPQTGLAVTRPLAQDLFLQLLPNGQTEALCVHVPATDLRATKTVVGFDDPKGLVAADRGVQHVLVHRRKDGSGTLKVTGKHVALTLPAAGTVRLTFGLRDPATAEAGNRCAGATVTLRAKKKGVLVYP